MEIVAHLLSQWFLTTTLPYLVSNDDLSGGRSEELDSDDEDDDEVEEQVNEMKEEEEREKDGDGEEGKVEEEEATAALKPPKGVNKEVRSAIGSLKCVKRL